MRIQMLPLNLLVIRNKFNELKINICLGFYGLIFVTFIFNLIYNYAILLILVKYCEYLRIIFI